MAENAKYEQLLVSYQAAVEQQQALLKRSQRASELLADANAEVERLTEQLDQEHRLLLASARLAAKERVGV